MGFDSMALNKIVSFIIPAYNSERYLEKCLNSFCCDEIAELIEVLIVDDGSTDRTSEIAEMFEKEQPEVFHIIHKENGGHGSAINVGVQKISGKYFKVIDSDDWIDSNLLPEYVHQLSKASADIVISPYCTEHTMSGKKTTFELAKELCGSPYSLTQMINLWKFFRNGFTFHGITYNRNFYLQWNHKLTEKVFYEDHEFATIPCCFAKTILPLNVCLYHYQLGDANQSVALNNQVKRSEQLKMVLRQMEKYYIKNQALMTNAGQKYYFLKLTTVINTYNKILCLADSNKKRGRLLVRTENQVLRKYIPELWIENQRKYKTFLLMSCLHISPDLYTKLLESKIYVHLKNR